VFDHVIPSVGELEIFVVPNNSLPREKVVSNVRSIKSFRVGRPNSRRQNIIYTVMVYKCGT
jgi:hypothetical protein